jgi:hypothetical protein
MGRSRRRPQRAVTRSVLTPEDNAELLGVLAGLARDRAGLDKRAKGKVELAVLRLVFRASLLIPVGEDEKPLLLPSLMARARGPGKVVFVFTDEEAAQGWIDARRPEAPACSGFRSVADFLGGRQPDSKRWRRRLQRGSVNLLSLNPAGPLTFTASEMDFDWASSRLIGRRAAAPEPDPEQAWLNPAARTAVRQEASDLLDELRQQGSTERTESEALKRFGSRLFKSNVFVLARGGNVKSKVYGGLGAASAGDPCQAIDALLEAGEMVLSALSGSKLDEQQRKRLLTEAKFVVSLLRGVTKLGYRTSDIKQFSSASKSVR